MMHSGFVTHFVSSETMEFLIPLLALLLAVLLVVLYRVINTPLQDSLPAAGDYLRPQPSPEQLRERRRKTDCTPDWYARYEPKCDM